MVKKTLNVIWCLAVLWVIPSQSLLHAEEPIPNKLSDPFMRGLTRSLEFDNPRKHENINDYRIDDLRTLRDHRYYRVVSIEEDEVSEIEVIDLSKKTFTGNAIGFYSKISTSDQKNELVRLGNQIIVGYKSYLRQMLVIQSEPDSQFSLNYGPFKTKDIAIAQCYFLQSTLKGDASQCKSPQQRPMTKNEDFDDDFSQAVLGLSQSAIMNFSESKLEYSKQDLVDAYISVFNDEPLGPSEYFITKINRYGVFLSSTYGEVTLIPSDSIPVNDVIEKKSTSSTENPTPSTKP